MSDLKHDVTAEHWAMLIKERMESGMTVREWRHDRNIKEPRYYYWLRILRRKAVENTGQPPPRGYRLLLNFRQTSVRGSSLRQPQRLSEKEILP